MRAAPNTDAEKSEGRSDDNNERDGRDNMAERKRGPDTPRKTADALARRRDSGLIHSSESGHHIQRVYNYYLHLCALPYSR
jgi:hypothetical protein